MYGLVTYKTKTGKIYRKKLYSPYLFQQFIYSIMKKKYKILSKVEEWE